jgi:NitT/TauT family transport system substrate-binding protein
MMSDDTHITLAVPFRVPFYAPFYAAVALGTYARHGLEVSLDIVGSGQAVVDALRSGTADAGWGGPARVMQEQERDADSDASLRSFCSVVRRDPFLLLGRHPRPDFRLQDLRDLRLGSVSEVPAPWCCLQEDLRRLGVDPDQVARVTTNTMAQNADALVSGAIDVAQLFEPYAAVLESHHACAVWAAAADGGDTAYTTFIATTGQIAQRRQALIKLCRGMSDALGWIDANGPDALVDAVAAHYGDIEPTILRRALERYFRLGIWSTSIHISPESFNRLGQALLSAGELKAMPQYKACVDATLADDALATLPRL